MRSIPLLVAALLIGCQAQDETSPGQTASEGAGNRAQWPVFRDAAVEAGLDFVHFNGATAEYFFPEIMGGGVALFDYDNDGDLDAYLVQSGRINDTTPLKFPDDRESWSNRLYRNDLVPDGVLSFHDVTAETGVGDQAYGMGAAVADVDGDGDQDLYVTNVGDDVLYLNQAGQRFERAGPDRVTPVSGWSTSASFLDYDRDGQLDLFVARYVRANLDTGRRCGGASGKRDYCSPAVFGHLSDKLLRGQGDGVLMEQRGWHDKRNANLSGLGVVAGDYDRDGWIDIYVANDQQPNQLWMNLKDGTFEELALMSGSAYNANGKPEASMGVTSADVDADGDLDLFMTHIKSESNTLYENDGRGNFSDATNRFQLAGSSLPATGFGTRWFDADNDGDLDIFSANGAVAVEASDVNEAYPYAQANQLFVNLGNGKFADASAGSPDFVVKAISRGAAFGDVDNDGDVDILVGNINGRPNLLLAEAPPDNHWLSVRLAGHNANRDALGASIGVERKGQPVLWRRVGTDGSYVSASDVRTHFGLGESSAPVNVVVRWPDATQERFADVAVNGFVTLTYGQGAAL